MAFGFRGQVKSAPISISAAGDNPVIAAVAGKIIVVVGLLLVNGVATAQSVTVKDGAANLLSGAMPLNTAGFPLSLEEKSDFDYYSTSNVANALILNLSAATLVTGTIWYVQK